MPTCSGHGGSIIQPGYGTLTVITASAVEAFLAKFNKNLAEILGPIIAGATYDLTTLCSSDPPDDPGLTLADVGDALNFYDPSVNLTAVAKVKQWFLSQYWWTVCECADGTQPTEPSPSDPGDPGPPASGLPTGTQGQNCWHVTQNLTVPAPETSLADFTPVLLPYTVTDPCFPALCAQGIPQMAIVPPGATQIIWTGSIGSIPSSGDDTNIFIQFYNAANSPLAAPGMDFNHSSSSTTITRTDSIPSTATHFVAGGNSTGGDFDWQVDLQIICAGQSAGGLNTPCCPPDPTLTAKLDQILGLLASTYMSVPVTLRSYADLTAHTGLSGNGSFTIDVDTIAVRVTMTTIPPQVGLETGDPTRYFDAGWITPFVGPDPYASIRIAHSPQIMVLPQLTDNVAYTLTPGVVATIAELTAGP